MSYSIDKPTNHAPPPKKTPTPPLHSIPPHTPAILNGGLVAAVQSDIVGYTTMTMEAGKWYQVGNPFVSLNDDVAPTLDNTFKGFSDGDIANVLNADASYAIYYWNSQLNGWALAKGIPASADVPLKTGQGVYIYKENADTITLSGAVKLQPVTFGREEGNAWDQFVPMWPEETALNQLKWQGLTDSDVLNVLDTEKTSYKVYYWNTQINGWAMAKGAPISVPDTETLKPGQAVYVNKVSPGFATLSK